MVLGGLILSLALHAAPPVQLSGQVFNPSICAKKRVDACGCHHVYGIRHCHPNRKTDHCEAPVNASVPDDEKKDNESVSM